MTQHTMGWFPAPGDDDDPAQPPQAGQRRQPQGINTGAWSVPSRANTPIEKAAPAIGSRVNLDGRPIAPAWKRGVSLAIDLATIAVVARLTSEPMGFVVILALIVSSGFGHTIGKIAMGIMVVRPVRWPGGQSLVRPGVARSGMRAVWHCLDTIFFWGVAFAFVNSYRRMPADALTHVIHIEVSASERWQALPTAPSKSDSAT